MHKMILTAKTLVDQETGSLSFLEFYDLPWVPKRIYWLKELTSKTSRGNHAHRKLSQLFIVIAGSLTIELFDGKEMVSYEMNKDSGQLLIEPGYWRVIKNASQDACLLVLADSPYDEEDYIRDWKAYLEWREEKEVD
jgi:dTDP-4-dehydrorhamnose 3,5-epimerase-like enzyme